MPPLSFRMISTVACGAILMRFPLLTGCATVKRSLKLRNTYAVRSEGRPELEKRVHQHIDSYLARPEFRDANLAFNGDIVIRTVEVDKKDRLGVPYWSDGANGRIGGVTLFTGEHLPVVIAVATFDGKWDERTLRHECAHAILLWNNIQGHPRKYRSVVPLWY